MNKLNIIGVYLAAGQSKRFFGDKLTESINNQPLGSIALKKALQSNLTETIVVTKEKNLSWLNPFLENGICSQIICHKSIYGQAESLKCGIHHAQQINANAVVIMLADQPFITTELINQIIINYETKPNSLFIAPKYQEEVFPPILIAEKMFSLLNHLTGDHGAKQLLLKHKNQGRFINFSEESYFIDLDTRADFLTLENGKTTGNN